MSSEKNIEQEKKELNILINKGIDFEIEIYEPTKERYFFGLLHKNRLEKVTKKFTIKEPTLSTLDRIANIAIDIDLDDEKVISDPNYTKVLMTTHTYKLSKLLAFAVLGNAYLKPFNDSGCIVYVEDKKTLDKFTGVFMLALTPSRLLNLCLTVTAMSNTADFLNSIRLMSANRTTMPIRIEENNEG